MPRRLLHVMTVAATLAAVTPQLALAQARHVSEDAAPLVAPRVIPPLDQELWAGISYREALAGVVILGGSAALVTWLTSSTITGLTAAASLAAAYIVYDPGVTGVLSRNDLPTLRDLSVNGSAQDGDK